MLAVASSSRALVSQRFGHECSRVRRPMSGRARSTSARARAGRARPTSGECGQVRGPWPVARVVHGEAAAQVHAADRCPARRASDRRVRRRERSPRSAARRGHLRAHVHADAVQTRRCGQREVGSPAPPSALRALIPNLVRGMAGLDVRWPPRRCRVHAQRDTQAARPPRAASGSSRSNSPVNIRAHRLHAVPCHPRRFFGRAAVAEGDAPAGRERAGARQLQFAERTRVRAEAAGFQHRVRSRAGRWP